MKKNSLKSFTIMEILIVISLIVLLAIIPLMALNPKTQIEKSQDSKRKAEVNQLQKVLEDWYNDKNCYPKPQQICYDTPDYTNSCHICGSNQNSPNFSPYLNTLPCDPQYPKKNYLYKVDNIDCPQKYWIYAKLSIKDDPIIEENKCTDNGCGPVTECIYNIGVSSPGTDLERCQNLPTITLAPTIQTNYYCRNFNSLYVLSETNNCNICGNYQECLNNNPNKTFFIDPLCQQVCIKN
ncbi:MAG: hypothetical protein KatS3mg092_0466 [Patescibacteria group bacterium]|nr:MAG: hypothetical protein KatS3mg092_0466 [Patescibacteria group bacterium]